MNCYHANCEKEATKHYDFSSVLCDTLIKIETHLCDEHYKYFLNMITLNSTRDAVIAGSEQEIIRRIIREEMKK